jgi:Tfp pilus assembly protein PilP
MLRQKLCDAATDALRLCRLESQGYSTSTLELIDPNDTPKNVMLRAIRKKSFDPNSKEAKAALERYLSAKKFLCGDKDTSSFHF